MSAKNPPIHPARLFVLFAREAPIGVIFRRGPKDWVQMIKWHTDTDTFEAGQWLRGDVEEYSGDLSPDGNLLLYGVFHKRLMYALEAQKREPDKLLYYAAISKPPYFSALELWDNIHRPNGKFIDNMSIQLYSYGGFSIKHVVNAVIPLHIDISPHYEFNLASDWIGEKNIFMLNQGWSTLQIGEYELEKFDPPHIWSKSSAEFTLYTSYAGYDSGKKQGGARNQFAYSLSTDGGKTQALVKNVNWADFDQQGRLVLAKEGKLFAGTLENGDLKLTELADFNANKPDPQPAPEWAQKW